MAADLVRRQVAVIAATGGNEAASAAKRATSSIPIVFTAGGDPVKAGLVTSLNRPGGNVTGVTPFTRQLGSKQLGLLQAIVPGAALIAVLVSRSNLDTEMQLREVQEAGRTLGLKILALEISKENDLEMAFATIVRRAAGAVLVLGGAFFTPLRVQLAILAAHHAVPAIYGLREFAMAGGLMSYGSNLTDAYRQVGVYVGRVLKGEKPADLPVMQPTNFQLVINLKTAKTLNLIIPPTLLALADEVIE
jgi:putative ABC transport system substrate-binding protein